jgi:hypothetical protein
MGLTIKNNRFIRRLLILAIFFIGVPVLLYYFGDFPERTVLMETLSMITILGFTLFISQFFSTRINKKLVKDMRMINVLKIHKIIGYTFISILLLHPLFIIVPKFFDNTVTPADALLKLITQFSSTGVIVGIIAYICMVVLLITSYYRFKLNLSYKIWRSLHGYFTMLFVVTVTWHVVNIGRHSNSAFSTYYVLMVASGIFYLLNTYLFKTSKK